MHAGEEAANAPDKSRLTIPALVLLAVLSAVWGWWAWKEGAFFGTVLLPGTIVLCLVGLIFAWLAPWPTGLRPATSSLVALAAFCGLGVWAALSALWSPTPDTAIADGQRVLVYAVAFGLGFWLCTLLRPRIQLCLVPLVAAALVAATAAIIVLLTTDVPRDVLTEGTVDYPLGYRNAQSAFFGIAAFCGLGLAIDRDLPAWLRALGLGTATLCIDFFLLAQSRGSLIAISVALIVYVLFAPKRGRALSWLALAALPAVAIVPPLTALYEAAQHGSGDALNELRTVGVVAIGTAVLSMALGALAARFEPRLPGLRSNSPDSNRAVGLGLAGLAVAGAIGFIVAVGNPADWVDQRIDEFRHAGSPDLSAQASRFGFNAGSDRWDLWRVALHDAGDDPLLGDGGGGYQLSYLRQRELAYQQVHDAHSIELEVLSELGFPGLALLLTALIATGIGVIRARRLGSAAAALAAIALASGAYWLVHTSIDWFWPYPAVTAPLLALLGSACAPVATVTARRSRIPWRVLGSAAVAVLALSAVSPFLSERYVNQAYGEWRSDLKGAYDDLDRARDLNRLSVTPLLAEGAIATAAGDRERALAAFDAAEAKRPEEWATHYLLARLQLRSDPEEARRQTQIALDLNPLEYRVVTLAKELGLHPGRD